MNITVTLDCSNFNLNKFDITVNDELNIQECINVVNESLKLNLELSRIHYCKSKREKRIITIYSSFKDNNIYTGDVLELL
ncbi:MAG: hypothetical protein ACI398_07040 [Clostridium sp.]